MEQFTVDATARRRRGVVAVDVEATVMFLCYESGPTSITSIDRESDMGVLV